MENQIYLKIISYIAPFIMTIVGYFIGGVMNEHKKNKEHITDIEKEYIKKEEFEKRQKQLRDEIENNTKLELQPLKEDIKELKVNFNTNNEKTFDLIGELKNEIKEVQINSVNKDEFFKSNASLSNKMDKLMDTIVEIKSSR